MIWAKNILFTISLLGVLGLSSILFVNTPKDNVVAEAINIDMSGYTKITSSNISSLKESDEVYLVLNDGSMGVGIGQTNNRANSKGLLTKFIVNEVEDNSLGLYNDGTGYITLDISYSQVIRANSSEKTLIDIDSDGHISHTYNDTKYALGYEGGKMHFTTLSISSVNYVEIYVLPDLEMTHYNLLAKSILNDISCDNGVTPPSKSNWELPKDIYDSVLISSEKTALETMEKDIDSYLPIKRALAKYDYILSKYGDSTYTNYLSRNISPLMGSSIHIDDMTKDSHNVAVISIIVISIISSLSILSYIFIRGKNK